MSISTIPQRPTEESPADVRETSVPSPVILTPGSMVVVQRVNMAAVLNTAPNYDYDRDPTDPLVATDVTLNIAGDDIETGDPNLEYSRTESEPTGAWVLP